MNTLGRKQIGVAAMTIRPTRINLNRLRALREARIQRISRFRKAVVCGWLGVAAFLPSLLTADDYVTGNFSLLIRTD